MFKKSKQAAFKPRRRNPQPVSAHPLFVPMLALWGAALAGLSVLVLPETMIAQLTRLTQLTALGGLARLVLAAGAGVLGAVALYCLGAALRPRAASEPVEAPAPARQRKRGIHRPAQLGSDRHDEEDELETDEFAEDEFEDEFEEHEFEEHELDADELDEDGFDDDEFDDADYAEAAHPNTFADTDADEDEDCEPFAEDYDWLAADPAHDRAEDDADSSAPAPEPFADPAAPPAGAASIGEARKDRAARISQRARRSGSKKVELVEALNGHLARKAARMSSLGLEPVASLASIGRREEAEPVAGDPGDHLDLGAFAEIGQSDTRTAAMRADPGEALNAAGKLRAVPPQQLSLVQMVERLALALHDHQAAARARPLSGHSPERDVALAEALRTLAMFTDKGFVPGAVPGSGEAAGGPTQGPTDATEREMRAALASLQRHRGAA